jgi:hypothetical protein
MLEKNSGMNLEKRKVNSNGNKEQGGSTVTDSADNETTKLVGHVDRRDSVLTVQTVLEDDLRLSGQSETVPRQCIDIVVYCPRQSQTVRDSGLGFLETVRDSSSDSPGQ